MGNVKVYEVCIVFSVFMLLSFVSAAKILGVFPINAQSHYNFNGAIMKTLADAGHQVTVIAPFPLNVPHKNLKIVDSRIDKSEINVRFANRDYRRMSWIKYVRMFTETMEVDCYNTVKVKEVQDLLHSPDSKFDVMFVQMLPMYECYLPIAKKFNIPVIGTFSFHEYAMVDEAIGNPHPYALPFTFYYIPKIMTFYERVQNAWCHLSMKSYYYFNVLTKVQEFYDQEYPSHTLEDNGNISLLFVNNHPTFFSRPMVQTLIEIGGIHIAPPKPLPKNIIKFIDEAQNGVILFSVGTISGGKVIDQSVRKIFRDVFAEIPQRVIWKFNESVVNLTDNVLVVDWMSQTDILAHEKVKLFISHCGIGGTLEAIHAAKPLVLMPINFDQPSNAALLHELEVGIYVDIKQLTKEILLNAIRKVLQEEKYTNNIQRLSRQFKDRPMSPNHSVTYWTEYVVKYNGTQHLDAITKNVPLYEYLLLDVFSFIFALFGFTIYALGIALKKIWVFYRSPNTKPALFFEKKSQ